MTTKTVEVHYWSGGRLASVETKDFSIYEGKECLEFIFVPGIKGPVPVWYDEHDQLKAEVDLDTKRCRRS